MNHHQIKILEPHYHNVKEGTKTFEIRINDRAYQKGDLVTLIPAYLESKTKMLGHEPLNFKIGDVYPIDDERVVFSLLKFEYQNSSPPPLSPIKQKSEKLEGEI